MRPAISRMRPRRLPRTRSFLPAEFKAGMTANRAEPMEIKEEIAEKQVPPEQKPLERVIEVPKAEFVDNIVEVPKWQFYEVRSEAPRLDMRQVKELADRPVVKVVHQEVTVPIIQLEDSLTEFQL